MGPVGTALLRDGVIEEFPHRRGIAIPSPVLRSPGGSLTGAVPKGFVAMNPLEELSECVRVIRIAEDEAVDFIVD
jgi:hypothetical protein